MIFFNLFQASRSVFKRNKMDNNWVVVSNMFIITPTWGDDPISTIFFKMG